MFTKRRITSLIISVHYSNICTVLGYYCKKSSTCPVRYTNESAMLRSSVNVFNPFPATLILIKLREIGAYFLFFVITFWLNKNFSFIMFVHVSLSIFILRFLATPAILASSTSTGRQELPVNFDPNSRVLPTVVLHMRNQSLTVYVSTPTEKPHLKS